MRVLLIAVVALAALSFATASFNKEQATGSSKLKCRLHSHPDGNKAQPYYGLRLDGLKSPHNGNHHYTFDFDWSGSQGDSFAWMIFDPQAKTVVLESNQVFGGRDIGNQYDIVGRYAFKFSYGEIEINPSTGAITTEYRSEDKGFISWETSDGTHVSPLVTSNMSGNMFHCWENYRLDNDDGRFACAGWVDHSGLPHIAASDFLFVVGDCVEANTEPCYEYVADSGDCAPGMGDGSADTRGEACNKCVKLSFDDNGAPCHPDES